MSSDDLSKRAVKLSTQQGEADNEANGSCHDDEGVDDSAVTSSAPALSSLSSALHRECSWSPESHDDIIQQPAPLATGDSLTATTVMGGDSLDEDEDEDEEDEADWEEEEEEATTVVTADDDGKHCWVCFASEEDDPQAQWTHPCRCRGTTKWIHQACIQRWVFEKQKGNMSAQVACPQCGHTYRITYPSGGIVVITLDSFEKMTQRICPIMFGGLCIGAIYWFGITFGAVTVMQTVGEERGQILLERTDPIFLIFALPLVPIGLVLGRMIPWEEPVLKTLRLVVPKVPLLRNVLPAFSYVPDEGRPPVPSSIPPVSNPICVTRTICSGLMYPSLAAFLGWALYSNSTESQLRRTLLGGATVFLVEGALSLYHKQHTFIRHSEWQIQNFDEDNTFAAAAVASAATPVEVQWS